MRSLISHKSQAFAGCRKISPTIRQTIGLGSVVSALKGPILPPNSEKSLLHGPHLAKTLVQQRKRMRPLPKALQRGALN